MRYSKRPLGLERKKRERGRGWDQRRNGEHGVGALQTIGGNLTLILADGKLLEVLSRGRM